MVHPTKICVDVTERMPTLKEAKGEDRKRKAGANVDFGAIWDILDSGLIQDEVNMAACKTPNLYTIHAQRYSSTYCISK